MATVTMKYGTRLIFNCETAFDEKAIAGITHSTSTDKKKGANSSLIQVDLGFTTGLIAAKAVTSMDLSGGTQARFWIKSSINTSSGDLKLLLDDTAQCASPIETISIGALTANTWTQVTLTLASPGSDTAIISIGLRLDTDLGAQDIYIDDIVLVDESKAYSNVLAVRGFDDVDEVRFYPTVRQELIDGSLRAILKTFGRRITIDFGVVSVKADRIFLLKWMLADESRQITYASETVNVVPAEVEGYANEWLDGVDFAKNFIVVCDEKTARLPSNLPSSWA